MQLRLFTKTRKAYECRQYARNCGTAYDAYIDYACRNTRNNAHTGVKHYRYTCNKTDTGFRSYGSSVSKIHLCVGTRYSSAETGRCSSSKERDTSLTGKSGGTAEQA